MVILKLIIGLVLLIAGAEVLVKGASRIAAAMKISPLVIGLTIVAFGTSSPELAVSVMSSLKGQGAIALGNVVGSNIFNVLFILGLSALIAPLIVAKQLIKLDVPIMIGVSLLVLLFAMNGSIGLLEGILLVLIGLLYVGFLLVQSRKEQKTQGTDEFEKEYGAVNAKSKGMWSNIVFVAAGLAMLIYGSDFLVKSAVVIASSLGVSELVIGLTIIAVGTSLPEVATSVIASLRGEREIAVGNVVGSNIFNLLFILGIASIFSPGGVSVQQSAINFDIPVMTAVAFACLPIFFTGLKIERWEGFIFLGYYIAYTVYVVLAAKQDSTLEIYSKTMLWFVLPLTVLTLGIVTYKELKVKKL
jgi:cation:H+ antiporter